MDNPSADQTAANLRAAALAFHTVGDVLEGTACVVDPDTLACSPDPSADAHPVAGALTNVADLLPSLFGVAS